ncbi:MAG: hypothetical protein KatS3mg087_1548 [Patescibacteria group bacterium]|nr:MAG: hypothetical protein KatS3mg087_1548 [Patescibacteria group bacterium]
MVFDSGVVYYGDCVELMSGLEPESVDCIFADPAVQFGSCGANCVVPMGVFMRVSREDWDSFESFAEYDEFTQSWLSEARRVLKRTGTIWVMGTYHSIYRVGSDYAGYGLLDFERDCLGEDERRAPTFGVYGLRIVMRY